MIKRLMLGAVAMTTAVVFATALFQNQIGGEALKLALQDAKLTLFVFRAILVTAIIYFWGNIVAFFAKKDGWPEEQIERALAFRNKMAVLLLAIEIIVVQGAPAHLIALFVGA